MPLSVSSVSLCPSLNNFTTWEGLPHSPGGSDPLSPQGLFHCSSQPSLCHLLPWFYRLGSKAQRWNSLLTVAAEAEDTSLQSVQGHEADVLKHVQTSATPWRQAQPLVLGRKMDSDIVGSWFPETLPNPSHNGHLQTSLLESPPQISDLRDNPNWVTVEVVTIADDDPRLAQESWVQDQALIPMLCATLVSPFPSPSSCLSHL